ncbi:MAG: hypothetical protein AAF355_12830 [Myxococcota bacterium]
MDVNRLFQIQRDAYLQRLTRRVAMLFEGHQCIEDENDIRLA